MTPKFDQYFNQLCESFNRRNMLKLIQYHQNKIRKLAQQSRNYDASPVDTSKLNILKNQAIKEYDDLISRNAEELEKQGLSEMITSFRRTLDELRRF